MTDYVAGLAPPARPGETPETRAGGRIFDEIGCQSCHERSWTTTADAPRAYLAGREIQPYTDLLLHDMGPGLADGYAEGNASGSEWRTAPLWGVGRTHEVEGFQTFLHDGRARNLTEAILWHGGEAETARDGFSALSKADRDALIAYLESL